MSRSEMLDLFYPVGSIYESADNTFNPNDAWGGTWTKIEGRFLLGSSSSYSIGATGGEATHVLTPAETALKGHTHSIPSLSGTAASAGAHTHEFERQQWYQFDIVNRSNQGSIYNWRSGGGTGGSASASYKGSVGSAGAHTHSVTTNASTTGNVTEANGAAHNNMPPYLVVNIWKRTA